MADLATPPSRISITRMRMGRSGGGSVVMRKMRPGLIELCTSVVSLVGTTHQSPTPIQGDEKLATPEIKELLLEAGPFARLSAMEQRTKLVKYFTSWFSPDFKVDTINNMGVTTLLILPYL